MGRVLSLDLPHRLQEGLLPLVSKLDAKKVQLGKLDAQVKVILKCVGMCVPLFGVLADRPRQSDASRP